MIDYDKVMRIGKQVLEDMYHRGYFDGQKDMPHDVAEAYNDGYADGQKDRDMDIPPSIDDAYKRGFADAEKKHNADLDYKNGLEDGRMEAWECARKIVTLSFVQNPELFGHKNLIDFLNDYSASEAIAKIKEYEQNQTDEMAIKALEQEPKTGHWIRYKENCCYNKCSICEYEHCKESNYCPNCGAKMVEPQESGVQE